MTSECSQLAKTTCTIPGQLLAHQNQLHGTLLQLLGIDHTRLHPDRFQRARIRLPPYRRAWPNREGHSGRNAAGGTNRMVDAFHRRAVRGCAPASVSKVPG